ncbi:MAG: iron chelate uptake ABC transporter family permease subunit [Acidobacteriota bacterium]|jgi:manganese/zinc/iron transport system permease protein
MELTFTARNVLLGATLLGALGGVLGSFALLRRQSLLGDALAHAALPGVCLAFLVTGTKDPLPLAAGALGAGLVGALVILAVVRWSRIKEDGAIGIVLSVFFGMGIVLLTHIQRLPAGNQSGLDTYLFGQAATLMERDLQVMAGLAVAVAVVLALFYKEFKLLTFDRAFAESLGLRVRALEGLLTLLLVTVVVLGLQTVGVVLIVATLITPAAAARQWTDSLGRMLALAGGIGAVSGASGALISAGAARLPTGPVIVLVASVVLVVSLLAAPRRGLIQAWLRERRVERRIQRENLLKDLYRAGEERGDLREPVSLPHLMGLRGRAPGRLEAAARALETEDLVERHDGALLLTPAGRREAAAVVRKHRLWELYLTRRLELASDHVHRDAEAMEHALTDEDALRLEDLLGYPETDPHGRAIPPPAEPRPGGAPS